MRKTRGLAATSIVVATLCLGVGRAESQDAVYIRNVDPPYAKVVVVDVSKPWTDTGIYLRSGDRLTIIARGVASTGPGEPTLWAGPDGIHLNNAHVPLPSANLWSLIGKIGDGGSPFFVGSFFPMEARASGELYLGYNDDNFGTNYGYYTVFIFGPGGGGSAVLSEGARGITPDRTRVLPSYPNPFNGGTRIEYELPRTAHVTVRIIDMTGRTVRTLADEMESAGTHRITWDGRDDNGIELPSGQYLCNIEVDGKKTTQKMMILR